MNLSRQITPPRVHHFRDGSISFTDAAVMDDRERKAAAREAGWETRRADQRDRDPVLRAFA